MGYVFLLRHPAEITGDPYQYHHGANLLVAGKGFIDAYHYQVLGEIRQTALHAPLYTVALAIPSLLGLRTPLGHQLWSCLIGTGTVGLVGLVGRRMAGPRVGLVAAFLVAVYPNAWLLDGLLGVETLTLFTCALALLAAYRLWQLRTRRAAAELGIACGLAALTRGEALLYLPFMLVPLGLALRQLDLRHRLRLGFVAGLAMVATLTPWVVFNLVRFHHPILVARFDVAMAPANCDDAYYGPGLGYWSAACFPELPAASGDESDEALVYREATSEYIRTHLDRLPATVLARIGRTFGFFRPAQQLELDIYVEGRDPSVARAGLAVYYLLVVAAVPGAVLLRRRRAPISPLLAVLGAATLAVAVTYGQTRYRASAELALVLLAAVALESLLRRALPPPGDREAGTSRPFPSVHTQPGAVAPGGAAFGPGPAEGGGTGPITVVGLGSGPPGAGPAS